MSQTELSDPTFYITIISSLAFTISEILPFFSSKPNGIIHSIVIFLSSIKNNNTITDNSKNKNTVIEMTEVLVIKDKLDKIINLIENNKNHK